MLANLAASGDRVALMRCLPVGAGVTESAIAMIGRLARWMTGGFVVVRPISCGRCSVLVVKPLVRRGFVRARLTSMVCMQGWQASQRGTELKPPPGARAGSVSTRHRWTGQLLVPVRHGQRLDPAKSQPDSLGQAPCAMLLLLQLRHACQACMSAVSWMAADNTAAASHVKVCCSVHHSALLPSSVFLKQPHSSPVSLWLLPECTRGFGNLASWAPLHMFAVATLQQFGGAALDAYMDKL
jgi:hypothetical protein